MKRIITLGILACIFAGIFSCKKRKTAEPEKEVPPPSPPVYSTYSALKPGNYWIYELYKVEQDGSSSSLNQFDSSYVEKDTVIRGKTYRKVRRFDFVSNKTVFTYLRDSLHYMINHGGKILFSSEDFSNEFYFKYELISINDSLPPDTMYRVSLKMDNRNQVTSVPAGTFITSNAQTTYNLFPPWSNGTLNPRFSHAKYAKDVGLVLETQAIYLGVLYTTEKRLIRYKVD